MELRSSSESSWSGPKRMLSSSATPETSPPSSVSSGTGVIAQRTHRKSRTGCRACKTRKVKCDERKPVCGPCSIHFHNLKSCQWDVPAPRKRVRTSNSRVVPVSKRPPSPLETAIVTRPSSITDAAPTRILELRLLHHFVTSTCEILPFSPAPAARTMWAIDTPQMAFESDFLLSALLGTAALHMRYLKPDDGTLETVARHYFDKALSAHRTAVPHADRQIAKPLVVTAWLLNLLSLQLTRPREYAPPAHAFGIAKGTVALYIAMLPWTQGTTITDYVHTQPPEPFARIIPRLPPTWNIALEKAKKEEEEEEDDNNVAQRSTNSRRRSPPSECTRPLPEMTYLLSSLPPSSPHYPTYHTFLQYLESLRHAIQRGEPIHFVRRRITNMAGAVSPAFAALVVARDPRALAMHAHHFAYMKLVSDVWWLEGTAEYEIRGITGLMPKEWRWAVEWPNYVIGLGREALLVAADGERIVDVE